MAEMPQMQRRMLVDLNPLLRGAEILFVKRYTYNSKHYYDDFQHISRWGGNLCVLSLADGRVREIAPQLGRRRLRPLRPVVRRPADRLRLPPSAAARASASTRSASTAAACGR